MDVSTCRLFAVQGVWFLNASPSDARVVLGKIELKQDTDPKLYVVKNIIDKSWIFNRE